MKLTRRNFLKVLGVGAAAVAIDPLRFVAEANRYSHFDPHLQYGNFITLQCDETIFFRKYLNDFPARALSAGIAPLGRQINRVDEAAHQMSPRLIVEAINAMDHEIVEVIPKKYRHRIVWIAINPIPSTPPYEFSNGTVAWKYMPLGSKIPRRRIRIA